MVTWGAADLDEEQDASGLVHDTLAGNPGAAQLRRGYTYGSLTEGLVGYWPLDGDATDSTEFGNDGTVTGATPNGSGQVGSDCYSFDGVDDYITVGPALAPGTGDWTLSAQFNVDSTDRFQNIYANEGETSAAVLKLRVDGSDLEIYLQDTDGLSVETVNTGGFSTGTWHHVAATLQKYTCSLYLDGVLEGTTTVPGYDLEEQNEAIGGDSLGGSTFGGLIDDVRVYDRALHSAEISALANLTETTPVGPEDTV